MRQISTAAVLLWHIPSDDVPKALHRLLHTSNVCLNEIEQRTTVGDLSLPLYVLSLQHIVFHHLTEQIQLRVGIVEDWEK